MTCGFRFLKTDVVRRHIGFFLFFGRVAIFTKNQNDRNYIFFLHLWRLVGYSSETSQHFLIRLRFYERQLFGGHELSCELSWLDTVSFSVNNRLIAQQRTRAPKPYKRRQTRLINVRPTTLVDRLRIGFVDFQNRYAFARRGSSNRPPTSRRTPLFFARSPAITVI